MKPSDMKELIAVLSRVHDVYGKPYDPGVAELWFAALAQFTIEDVRIALTRHIQNPDTGQFMPKPADVVKMLHGGTGVQGMAAWTKVEQAIRLIGPYQSVVFDDPIIHRVIEDMGGWVRLASLPTDEDLKFAGLEFGKRYQGYKLRGGVGDEYPYRLVGIAEAHNAKCGYEVAPPKLVGDPEKAAVVSDGGRGGQSLQITDGKHLPQLIGQVTQKLLAKGNP